MKNERSIYRTAYFAKTVKVKNGLLLVRAVSRTDSYRKRVNACGVEKVGRFLYRGISVGRLVVAVGGKTYVTYLTFD